MSFLSAILSSSKNFNIELKFKEFSCNFPNHSGYVSPKLRDMTVKVYLKHIWD